VTYDSVIAGFAERGLTPEPANIEAVGAPAVSLVAEGSCWKLASRTMIEEANAEPGVVFRQFSDPPLPFGLWLRHSRLSTSPLGQQFAAICVARDTADTMRHTAGHTHSLAALWPAWVLAEIWWVLQGQVLLS
jgi:hypothetical protein